MDSLVRKRAIDKRDRSLFELTESKRSAVTLISYIYKKMRGKERRVGGGRRKGERKREEDSLKCCFFLPWYIV